MLISFKGEWNMYQSEKTQRTTNQYTADVFQNSPETIDDLRQKRKSDVDLLQLAWHTAHQIAEMLYEEFGATKVGVFGSLVEKDAFTQWSDIDMAVWGLPTEDYFKALSAASDICSLFKVDIIDFENSKGIFKQRIQQQHILIEKGVIYEVDRSSLFMRISDERAKIGETVAEITERLEKVKVAPSEYREEIETTIAKNLADCYRGFETIFRHIAVHVDLQLPDGSRWHKELLTQMAQTRGDRQPVISPETYEFLQELLEFRHVFNNIYGKELVYEKTEENAKRIKMLYERVSEEIDDFIASLSQQKNP